jgi:hypothetical protein
MVPQSDASGGGVGCSNARQRIALLHEVCPESIDQVLHDGIRCQGSGEKTAGAEQQADTYLDGHAPACYTERGLGRRTVVYGYMPIDDGLIDITTGEAIDVGAFAAQHEQVLVRMDVERSRCYVSDLDCYDIVKDALKSSWPPERLRAWAARYWTRVTPLNDYAAGSFRRPEVMVIGDIAGPDITVVSVN